MFQLIRTTPLAALAAMALAVAACSGSEPSGLATLESVTTTTADDSLTAASADVTDVATAATETTTTATTATADPASDADSANAGASGAGTDADPGSGASGSDDLSDEERWLELAQCMRDNGVEFPDPVVEADGTVAFGLRPGRGGGGHAETLQDISRDPDLPAAQAACQPIIEGLALGPGGQSFDEVRIELMDRLLEFAQCMRDNGVDVPDPDPNAFSPGGGSPFGDLDFDDADVSEAFEVCGDRLPGRPGRGSGQ